MVTSVRPSYVLPLGYLIDPFSDTLFLHTLDMVQMPQKRSESHQSHHKSYMVPASLTIHGSVLLYPASSWLLSSGCPHPVQGTQPWTTGQRARLGNEANMFLSTLSANKVAAWVLQLTVAALVALVLTLTAKSAVAWWPAYSAPVKTRVWIRFLEIEPDLANAFKCDPAHGASSSGCPYCAKRRGLG